MNPPNDYLDRVEAELSRLTEQGAHRRLRARAGAAVGGGGSRPPRRRTEALALASAIAVVAAVVAIVLLNVHSSPSRQTASPAARGSTQTTSTATSTTHRSSTTRVPGIPTGQASAPIITPFHPESFSAISELTWWILGPAPCTFVGLQPPCGEIIRTTDGGRNFIGLEAPRASLAGRLSASGFSQIRFADLKNGFAYGPDLYATHDGGTTWDPVDVGGQVNDLAISGGEVYAVVSPNGTYAGHLMRSPVGQDQWTTVSPAGEVAGGLWVQGSDILVQTTSNGAPGLDVLVSRDGGASFARYRAPGSAGLPCELGAPVAPVVWALCVTGTESGLWRSTDGGETFAPGGGRVGSPLPNSAQFAAASDTTAVVGSQQLYRTDDGGASYMPVGPAGISAWAYLGFTDATHGVAIGFLGPESPSNERLYYTTDGGLTYHLVALP